MKKIYIFLSVSLLVFITACSPEIDNYTEPGESLSGKVIDAVTGQPLQTEQPNGFEIRFKEIGYSADAPNRFFWGKADGTFQNTKIFANEYEITAVNGPFIQPETQKVVIKGSVQLDFTVTPYLNISDVSHSLSGDELTVTYRLNRPEAVTAKINNAFAVIDWNPNVSNAVSKTKQTINYAQTDDNDILSNVQTIKVNLANAGIKKGYTYYVRIGACTSANTSRYNYSAVLEFDY